MLDLVISFTMLIIQHDNWGGRVKRREEVIKKFQY